MKKLLLLNEQMRLEKKKLHKQLVEEHKFIFRMLDIAAIVLILMNFGAVFMTNSLVIKAEPNATLYEVNPYQAEQHNYEIHPETSTLITALLAQIVLWILIIAAYIHYRTTIYTENQMRVFATIVTFYFLLMGYDFWNDAGFFVAKVIYGS